MHSVHAGYTVIARLKADCADAVSTLLADMRAQPERLPFEASVTTHFATCTVLPAQKYGDEELPACLMIATSFCGPSRKHEDDLVLAAGPGLRALLQHCEGFSASCTDAELKRFLRAHRHGDTFYSGMQNLTRAEVFRHNELRIAIGEYIDAQQKLGGLTGTATSVRSEIQRYVRTRADLAWTMESWTPDPSTLLARHWRSLLVIVLALTYGAWLHVGTTTVVFVASKPLYVTVACSWLVIIAGLFAVFALVQSVRDAEEDQTYVAPRQPDAHVNALDATQCHPVINEMTIVGPVKEGAARPITLRLALWIVARVAEGIPYIPGLRGGITIPTVATARWIAADGGRRLVFISNFTNASEPYVRDFIDIHLGAMRINLTFGFGRGYPKTSWIVLRGAIEDPNGFINVVHANQCHTDFWFCPYKNLSVDNIRRNQAIREGLFGNKTEEQAREWLQLL
jgi:hypothetical protein